MSESKIMRLNDKIGFSDRLVSVSDSNNREEKPFIRGRVMGGFDRYVDKNGISQLGETLFDLDNMVVIGGTQYFMEQAFQISGPLSVPYLNDVMGIGHQDSPPHIGQSPFPLEHKIVLFGIGTGGCGDSYIDVKDVTYNEYRIEDMIPFRFTDEDLVGTDVDKYYGKKLIDGKTAYYLKKFDIEPEIKHLWKDGEEGEDGSVVDSSVFNSSRKEPIESFTEINLTITKKDIKEWFIETGRIEESRFNSIALMSASYRESEDGNKDYDYVRMISKLNIPNEPMSLTKNLQIIYRLYTS